MIADVITIVLAQMPVDKGIMVRKGASFFDTPYEIIIDYNTAAVPHIIYQEEGFTHYLSKEFIDVNEGFISRKTVGQLTTYGWSKALDIEFNMLENEQRILDVQDKMLTQMGVTYDV